MLHLPQGLHKVLQTLGGRQSLWLGYHDRPLAEQAYSGLVLANQQMCHQFGKLLWLEQTAKGLPPVEWPNPQEIPKALTAVYLALSLGPNGDVFPGPWAFKEKD